MRYNLLLIALTITLDMISSQGYQQLENLGLETEYKIQNFNKVLPIKEIKPFQLGGKILNKDNLKNVPEEQINALLKMAYPSISEQWYGKDSSCITHEDLNQIDQMSEEVRKDLQFKILPTRGSGVMGNEDNCTNYYACKGCLISGALCWLGSGGGLLWGMCSSMPMDVFCKIWALKIFLPSISTIPVGTIAGEITSCICNRFCTEREIWAHKPDDKK